MSVVHRGRDRVNQLPCLDSTQSGRVLQADGGGVSGGVTEMASGGERRLRGDVFCALDVSETGAAGVCWDRGHGLCAYYRRPLPRSTDHYDQDEAEVLGWGVAGCRGWPARITLQLLPVMFRLLTVPQLYCKNIAIPRTSTKTRRFFTFM